MKRKENNKTRKIKKTYLQIESVVNIPKRPIFWDQFIDDGKKHYNYMINNYSNLINDSNISHLSLQPGLCRFIHEHKIIQAEYLLEIEKELINWITIEYNNGNLFNEQLWKPFRDCIYLAEMKLGYKKIFKFKHYCFQLTLEKECEDDCKTCGGIYTGIHFNLSFYGWLNEDSKYIQPENKFQISDDCMIPEGYWKIY